MDDDTAGIASEEAVGEPTIIPDPPGATEEAPGAPESPAEGIEVAQGEEAEVTGDGSGEAAEELPEQTDNRPRDEDGPQDVTQSGDPAD